MQDSMEEAPRRVPFYMSEEDMAYVKPLIDRYGVDYKKMACGFKAECYAADTCVAKTQMHAICQIYGIQANGGPMSTKVNKVKIVPACIYKKY